MEQRRQNNAIQDAKNLLSSGPPKSCIKAPRVLVQTKQDINKQVKFEVTDKPSDEKVPGVKTAAMNPAHWTDKCHEPDGSHPALTVGSEPGAGEQLSARALAN